ncbi:MAG: HlyD family efflux transporter periplasmic adaptor subunit [Desulfobacteraceae bacterium]|nr:HlyD family efflux transporter periplasmic adaptor subunit [Desulfobacteraceae bacterium]
MKLRTKKSHFQNLSEGRAPRRILPVVMKVFYFLVLLSILGGVCYLVLMKFLYFKGTGQVEIEKRILSSKKGGTVTFIGKVEGETFAAGDLLAVIDPGQECLEQIPDILPTRLFHEIQKIQAEYKVYQSQLGALESVQKKPVLYRALEIGQTNTSLRKLEIIQQKQERLKEKMALLAAEITIKKKELTVLEKHLTVEADTTCDAEKLLAPFNGVVSHVTRQKDEYIDKGDSLMVVMPENALVAVEAYLDWQVLDYIDKGEIMTIIFPDGLATRGMVTGFTSAAMHSPQRFRKDYVPVESKLLVHLSPLNEKDAFFWKRYDRMDVRVRGERK